MMQHHPSNTSFVFHCALDLGVVPSMLSFSSHVDFLTIIIIIIIIITDNSNLQRRADQLRTDKNVTYR